VGFPFSRDRQRAKNTLALLLFRRWTSEVLLLPLFPASPQPAPTATPVIETLALVKCYAKVRAVDGLDLAVSSGEIYGFLGPNGAGKTTTIRILTGITRPSGGTARVSGADVVHDPVTAKARIGVVSQHVNLDPDLTVFESLKLHAILHGMDRARSRQRIGELMTFAGLADRAEDLGRTLSGGLKRRVTIIRALLHEPEILFLDEPTVGLDPPTRRRMWDLIRSIHREGVTVFLTTHYIEEAEFLCHRVGIIDRGQLIDQNEPRRMLQALGEHAVDVPGPGETHTRFFPTRDTALAFLGQSGEGAAVRRTNLEDVFIQKTGRKVAA
jgi:ABC-2 type transport system ATP-binding protein